jgi:hypothetical protein
MARCVFTMTRLVAARLRDQTWPSSSYPGNTSIVSEMLSMARSIRLRSEILLRAPPRLKHPEKSIKRFSVGMALGGILDLVANPFQLLRAVPSQPINKKRPAMDFGQLFQSILKALEPSPVGQGKTYERTYCIVSTFNHAVGRNKRRLNALEGHVLESVNGSIPVYIEWGQSRPHPPVANDTENMSCGGRNQFVVVHTSRIFILGVYR